MKKLNEKEWKTFSVADLFEIKKVRGLPIQNYKDGNIPYASTSSVNNAIIDFITAEEKEISRGNSISIDPIQGKTFYHKYNYVGRGFSGASINSVYNEKINEYSALFLTQCIEKIAKEKASYGYLFNSKRLEKGKILLPINNNGDPDYEYMETYAKNLRDNLLKRYKNFVEKQMKDLEYKEVPLLEEKEWKKFKAFGNDGLFDITATKSGIDSIRIKEGENKILPYITRSDLNNGISQFVSIENKEGGFNKGKSITIGLDTQTAFWQDHEFVTGQNIQVVTSDKLNPYIGQFIVIILKKQMVAKFNWGGNGATLGRLKKLNIMLPINSNGAPDYNYIEQYIKNILFKKYNQYLKFINKI